MFGVVNPTEDQNLDSYYATIPVNGPAEAPLTVTGGELVTNPGAIDQTTLVAAGNQRATLSLMGAVGVLGAMAFLA